ncbi:hypothetical protein LA635_p1036 (plasmid) [Erwinia amylovora LA635]|uniref:Uncharacterized protein n=1 Tax=Erwinia amylovora TaxID=552 RepID=A0A0P0ZGF1_ERWAM|nr:hypothetical protein LA635_p1036 [Erwinia amylovora LA635]CDK23813.1 hypothetical protein LA636_p1035 [Erwinia amylovora LA636]CDK23863.1 hypothetical protein LA637_p1036 [Erwinia amylovora LA637]CDM08161.1 hypothetical protein EAMY692_p20035 [Erwinia amylovora]
MPRQVNAFLVGYTRRAFLVSASGGCPPDDAQDPSCFAKNCVPERDIPGSPFLGLFRH